MVNCYYILKYFGTNSILIPRVYNLFLCIEHMQTNFAVRYFGKVYCMQQHKTATKFAFKAILPYIMQTENE